MKQLLLTLVVICTLVISGCKSESHGPIGASLVQLIASPNKYHKKMVRVIGVVQLEFEGDSVCLSKEHIKHSVSKNCLWLSLDFEKLKFSREQLDIHKAKYFIIEGVFNENNLGHMGLFSGAIENISRFEPWEINTPNKSLNKDATDVAPIS